tara:strand:- start:881 stop:994 length:114 start_codon:yes stop_codon:yes gene_type:complete
MNRKMNNIYKKNNKNNKKNKDLFVETKNIYRNHTNLQ